MTCKSQLILTYIPRWFRFIFRILYDGVESSHLAYYSNHYQHYTTLSTLYTTNAINTMLYQHYTTLHYQHYTALSTLCNTTLPTRYNIITI